MNTQLNNKAYNSERTAQDGNYYTAFISTDIILDTKYELNGSGGMDIVKIVDIDTGKIFEYKLQLLKTLIQSNKIKVHNLELIGNKLCLKQTNYKYAIIDRQLIDELYQFSDNVELKFTQVVQLDNYIHKSKLLGKQVVYNSNNQNVFYNHVKLGVLTGINLNNDIVAILGDNKLEVVSSKPFRMISFTGFSSIFEGTLYSKIDLSNVNTCGVSSMRRMFAYTKATWINLRDFDATNVIDMEGAFSGVQLGTLDLSSFKTPNLEVVTDMFLGANIKLVDLRNISLDKIRHNTDTSIVHCNVDKIILPNIQYENPMDRYFNVDSYFTNKYVTEPTPILHFI